MVAGSPGQPNLHQQQGRQQTDQAPPPAALSFINSLRETIITSDDLIEENNKECLICLDEHVLGGKAVKLPCGHLYHGIALLNVTKRDLVLCAGMRWRALILGTR